MEPVQIDLRVDDFRARGALYEKWNPINSKKKYARRIVIIPSCLSMGRRFCARVKRQDPAGYLNQS